MQIQISNYRPISAGQSLTLDLSPSVTFLLGKNNTGKSAILRIFSELQQLFSLDLDIRQSREFQINVAPIFWDSLSNRANPKDPLVLDITDGRSTWRYELRHAGSDQHTSQLNVRFVPLKYAEDNEAAIRVHRILRKALFFGPLRSTTFNGVGTANGPATGNQFVNMWNEWSSGPNVHHRNATRLLEREIRTLFGFDSFKLTLNHERNELIADYDEGSFKLSELGEGLSHFIVVLANALIRQPTYIFIDEPENGLHPKLQATFVQTLASKATHGLVAASHSMALARNVADQVLYCTKDPGKGLSATAHQGFEPARLVDELREMSYSQHVETGEQNLLLVEGRTDIKAYRELLKLYRLDQRFILISLGGGEFFANDPNAIEAELSELRSIGAKSITAIIDSEKNSAASPIESQRQTFANVCKKLGFEIHVLERRALENYFKATTIQQIFGPATAGLGPYERRQGGASWPKTSNWRIVARMTAEDFSGTDIGTFIQQSLIPKAAVT